MSNYKNVTRKLQCQFSFLFRSPFRKMFPRRKVVQQIEKCRLKPQNTASQMRLCLLDVKCSHRLLLRWVINILRWTTQISVKVDIGFVQMYDISKIIFLRKRSNKSWLDEYKPIKKSEKLSRNHNGCNCMKKGPNWNYIRDEKNFEGFVSYWCYLHIMYITWYRWCIYSFV